MSGPKLHNSKQGNSVPESKEHKTSSLQVETLIKINFTLIVCISKDEEPQEPEFGSSNECG